MTSSARVLPLTGSGRQERDAWRRLPAVHQVGVRDPQRVGVPRVLAGIDDVLAEVGVNTVEQDGPVDAAE